MFNLNELLILDTQNEHDSEHDLSKKKNYSVPKIYNTNGDIKKRWYVNFSYRNPSTGKLQRIKNIYGVVNKYKTKEERMSVLVMYQKTLVRLLKQGYNPFEDNAELYQKSTNTTTRATTTPIEIKEESSMALQETFDFGLQIGQMII